MASFASITPALTTTFIPEATTCTENRLSMLANRAFEIWMNEPVPVPGSTFTACHPSQFIQSYTLLGAKVTQPAFNPLICPQNYETIGPFTSNYIACCPSGYQLANPTADPFSDRPAFGGTCYSPIEIATPVIVTAYGSSGPTATITFSATATNAQAYAHPYEGFAFGVAQVQTIVPTNSTTRHGLSAGAKVGIALGISIPVLLATITFFFFLYHRRRNNACAQHKESDQSPMEYYPSDQKILHGIDKPLPPPKGEQVYSNSIRNELPGDVPVELPAGRFSVLTQLEPPAQQPPDALESPSISPISDNESLRKSLEGSGDMFSFHKTKLST